MFFLHSLVFFVGCILSYTLPLHIVDLAKDSMIQSPFSRSHRRHHIRLWIKVGKINTAWT